MNEAAKLLFNHTDFQSFLKVNTDVNTFDCTILWSVLETREDEVVFTISANRFLKTWCDP
jgi:tRNA pseudouridine38-40 synthase